MKAISCREAIGVRLRFGVGHRGELGKYSIILGKSFNYTYKNMSIKSLH